MLSKIKEQEQLQEQQIEPEEKTEQEDGRIPQTRSSNKYDSSLYIGGTKITKVYANGKEVHTVIAKGKVVFAPAKIIH